MNGKVFVFLLMYSCCLKFVEEAVYVAVIVIIAVDFSLQEIANE